MFGRASPEAEGVALVARAKTIETREDFHQFALLLSQNYRKRRREWENDQLGQYLGAIAGFSGDFEGYVQNSPDAAAAANPWRLLATILLEAKVYE